jgi:hypothetical protein
MMTFYHQIIFMFLEVWGENTLGGGHFGHFHNMYVKYIFAKHITFNFGFHFWCLGLLFLFSQS